MINEDSRESSLEHKRQRARENLVSSRNFIFLAIGIFLAGIGIGFAFPERFNVFLEGFKQSVAHYTDKSSLVLIITIFFRNFFALIVSTFLGLAFGVVPALAAVANGILAGATISVMAGSDKIAALWLLVPHGIFELPAAMIAWGLGLWHGAWIFRRDRKETMKERRRKVMLVFFYYCLPLLAVAAVIEGLVIKALAR